MVFPPNLFPNVRTQVIWGLAMLQPPFFPGSSPGCWEPAALGAEELVKDFPLVQLSLTRGNGIKSKYYIVVFHVSYSQILFPHMFCSQVAAILKRVCEHTQDNLNYLEEKSKQAAGNAQGVEQDEICSVPGQCSSCAFKNRGNPSFLFCSDRTRGFWMA